MGKESARYPQLEMLLHFTSFWSCIGIALHDLGPFFCDWPFNIFQQRTMRLLNLLLPPHIYLLTVKMNTNKQPEGHEWFSNFFPTSSIHIGINDQHVVQRVTRTEVTKKNFYNKDNVHCMGSGIPQNPTVFNRSPVHCNRSYSDKNLKAA